MWITASPSFLPGPFSRTHRTDIPIHLCLNMVKGTDVFQVGPFSVFILCAFPPPSSAAFPSLSPAPFCLHLLRLPAFIFCAFPPPSSAPSRLHLLLSSRLHPLLPSRLHPLVPFRLHPLRLSVFIFFAFPPPSSAAFSSLSLAPSRLHPLLPFCIYLLRLPAFIFCCLPVFIFCCRDCCWPGMSCLNDMIEYTKTILLFYGFKKTICKISVYTDCASPENRSHQSFHSGKFKITYRFTVLIIYEQHRAIN